MTRIELDDGKYTVVHDSGAGLHALRYGEHWRDMTGDGLVLAMAQEIEDLRRRIAPVQQVSAPDGWRLVKVGIEGVQFGNAWFSHEGITGYTADQLNSGNCRITGRAYMDWLAAAPAAQAAPAADAGLVEALDYQALFDAIAAATSVYANGAINISVQAFRDALAAHRTQGVV